MVVVVYSLNQNFQYAHHLQPPQLQQGLSVILALSFMQYVHMGAFCTVNMLPGRVLDRTKQSIDSTGIQYAD